MPVQIRRCGALFETPQPRDAFEHPRVEVALAPAGLGEPLLAEAELAPGIERQRVRVARAVVAAMR